MKIALVGYGKMGKVVEEIALQQGHTISFKIRSNNADEIFKINPNNTDVAIEFSIPATAPKNLVTLITNKVPVVCGTTAWLDQWEKVEESVLRYNGAFLYASNFSIGVNIFFAINQRLSAIMNDQPSYEVEITEIHHIHKLDKPSGTGISLAHGIIRNHENYDRWLESPKEPSDIPINSLRQENVPGTHMVKWSNEIDEIEIKHTAKSRKGFAKGAVLAAEWIVNKEGIYSMNDVLNL